MKQLVSSNKLRRSVLLAAAFAGCGFAQAPAVHLDLPFPNSVVIGAAQLNGQLKTSGWAVDASYLIDQNSVNVYANGQQFGAGYGIPRAQLGAQANYSDYYDTAYRPDVCAGITNSPNCQLPYPGPCGGANQPTCGASYVGFEADIYFGDLVPLPALYSFWATARNTHSPEITGTSTVNSPVWVENVEAPYGTPSPISSTTLSQQFTFTSASPNYDSTYNPEEVSMFWVLINTTQQDAVTAASGSPNGGADQYGNGPCFFQVDIAQLSPTIKYYAYIVNNNGNGWQPFADITSGGTLSNSQCTLSFGAPSISPSPLSFPVIITAQGSFLGQTLDIWVATFQEQLNSNNGWRLTNFPGATNGGTWSVPTPSTPVISSPVYQPPPARYPLPTQRH